MNLDFYIKKRRGRGQIAFLVLALIVKVVLSFFVFELSKTYGYYGVVFDPRPAWLILLSYLTFAFIALSIDVRLNKASNVLHFMLFTFCFIPISVQYDIYYQRDSAMYWMLAGMFILIPILKDRAEVRLLLSNIRFNFTIYQYLYSAVIIAVLMLIVLIKNHGFDFNISGITEVYDQRAVYKAETNRLSQYSFNWLGNVLNVLLILIGVARKNKTLLFVGLAMSVYLFSIGGHKSMLFVGPLGLMLFILYRILRKNFILGLMGGLSLLFGSLLFVDLFLGRTTFVSSLIVRRGVLLPSQIYYNYGEFFSSHPLNYFSHSFPFNFIFNSPYSDPIPSIVGKQYFAFSDTVYANCNVFGDTFGQVVFWAFPLLTFVLITIYHLIDNVSANRDFSFVIPLLFISSLTLVNSGLIVSLITHGMLIGILAINFYPKTFHTIKETTVTDSA